MTATTTPTRHTAEIKQDVQDLSKKIQADMKIIEEPNDPARGLVVIESKIYEENLPEGLTVETVKAVDAYNSLFLASTTLAIGEQGVPFFKKHKAVDRISSVIPTVGKDTVEVDLRRSVTYPKPNAAPGETVTKYAVVTTQHIVHGTRNVGDIKKAKERIANLGAEALAK